MIDVSIIVPVYNVRDYLEKCLESLVNQDYEKNKLEIFIIDDCSEDGSVNIINKYKEKYKFITVKKLEKNQGVSHARNIGIQESKGEFLMFCDSDDFYEKNAVSCLMGIARKNDSDFVMSDYFITDETKNIAVHSTDCFLNEKITKQEIVSYMTLTSCGKLIKKNLFTDNNILYPENIKRCEELTVIPVLAYLANNPIAIKMALYHYVQRSTSASNTKQKDISLEELSFFDETFLGFEKIINDNMYQKEIEFRAIDHLLYGKSLVMLKSNMSNEVLKFHIKEFEKKYPNYISNIYFKKYSLPKRIFIYCLKMKLIFAARCFAKLHGKLTG